MTQKRKLLFLAQTLPYPPTGGVTLRTYNVLKQLAQAYDITLLSFDCRRTPSSTPVPPENLDALSRLAHTSVFKVPQYSSRSRLIADHVRSIVTGRVHTVFRLSSAPFRDQVLRTLEEESPDVVHLDSLDLSAILPYLPLDRVAVTHHNVESELLERRSRIETDRLRRAYFRFQGELQSAEERRWCRKVAINVTVSDRDGEELARRVGGGRYATIPNGVDTEFFTPGSKPVEDQSGIVFVGGTTWFPNRDALEYFASELHPRLVELTGGVRVKWIGRASPEEISTFAEPGIEMTGFVDDIRGAVQSAACFILPFRVGGGTRLKLLDAWAMGKAVVSTSQGAEGVNAVEGVNILIRDDPEEFVHAVSEVLLNDDLRSRLGQGARRTAEADYSWDKIGRSLRSVYSQI